MGELDLTTLDGLAEALRVEHPTSAAPEERFGPFDGTFCPRCGAIRRMYLYPLFWADRWGQGTYVQTEGRSQQGGFGSSEPADGAPIPAAEDAAPAFYGAQCVQCESVILLVVYQGPDGRELVALPSTYGGVATPATPPAVAFFLDQARRAEAVAAYTAATVMYRSALEQLLHEQGFTERMLGNKIKALLVSPTPPQWLDRLDPAYLNVIRDLGNAAVHAGSKEVDEHRVLEVRLLRQVHALFAELLDEIYEQPQRSAARLDTLRAAADSLSAEGS